MNIRRSVVRRLPLLALASFVLLVACEGSEEETDVAPSPTPVAARTTVPPTPVVEGDIVVSTAFGYRARIPDGWTVQGNFLTSEIGGGDAFFAPGDETANENSLKTNIAVVCEVPRQGEQLESFVTAKADLLRALNRQDLVQTARPPVAGREARQLQYRLEREPLALEKVEVYFLSNRCSWSISLTTTPGELETYRPIFEDFLRSFQVEE